MLLRIGQHRVVWALALMLLATETDAATLYHLKVRGNPSVPLQVVFALTCSDSAANTLTILNAVHDGSAQLVATTGGPISGALLGGSNPADTTVMSGGTFYSDLRYLLLSGNTFDCDLSVTEQGPQSSGVLSQVTLYYQINTDVAALSGMTTDPTGNQALAAIDISGAAGGELSVFSPLSFVAPDTLLFDAALVGVPREDGGEPRVRFAPVAPNPARGKASFRIEFPRKEVARLRIYDVAGRVVAELLNGAQEFGRRDVIWAGTDRRGAKVAAGVYLAELRYGSQTIVRRFVLTR